MTIWLAAPAVVALTNVLLNAGSWRRPRPMPHTVAEGAVVLIPARNEARRIAGPLRAATPQASVAVLDDQSEDGTGQVARDAGAQVLSGEPLPPGWVGKTWALQQLGARSAPAEVLLFIDADVELASGAVARVVDELRTCDVFTAVPRQLTGTAAERLLMPLLHLTYAAWLPLALVEWLPSPAFTAANGQLLAMRRDVWERLGGLHAVADDLVDDMAIARLAKRQGLRVRFADGDQLASTRMYEDLDGIVRGFSKNIFEGLGSAPALLAVIALYLAAFVLPYALLGAAMAGATGLWSAAVLGVGANVVTRAVLAWRHGHTAWSVLLHPLAVLGLIGIALNSWRWAAGSRIEWAGRRYARRVERRA